MNGSSGTASSLLAALNRQREKPAPLSAFTVVIDRFLDDNEIVHLALEGNGWTWVDPLMLVTDRRVLLLRRGVFGFWGKRGEIAASEVSGATLKVNLFFGRITVRSHGGKLLRMGYNWERNARDFVDSLNQMISGDHR
ncbi:PH domain-containing protein [Brevibacterium picturae]|uniref:YokE-like PH domain-containing protein n=1 Tax=Brevibacterium picturae TaxID=260553 RepID=A0ABP4MRE4_9MICO